MMTKSNNKTWMQMLGLAGCIVLQRLASNPPNPNFPQLGMKR